MITDVNIFNGSNNKESATNGEECCRLKWMAVECCDVLKLFTWTTECRCLTKLYTRIKSSTHGSTPTYSFIFFVQDIFIRTPLVHKQHTNPFGYQENYLQIKNSGYGDSWMKMAKLFAPVHSLYVV